jgi:hypothetical protein
MHPNPGHIDANDETVTIIDDEELVDRGELQERVDHDTMTNSGVDDSTIDQHNHDVQIFAHLSTRYDPAVEDNDFRTNVPVVDTAHEKSPWDPTLRYFTVASRIVRILKTLNRYQ